MAAFKCADCGNLHGAPQQACGQCGSPTVLPFDESTGRWVSENEPAGGAPDTQPPPPATDQVLREGLAMFAAFIAGEQQRNAARDERHAELDKAEAEQRAALMTAGVEALGALTLLIKAAAQKLATVG
jgi:hypothetical protein